MTWGPSEKGSFKLLEVENILLWFGQIKPVNQRLTLEQVLNQILNSLVNALYRGRKKWEGSFLFRPDRGLTATVNPFGSKRKNRLWGKVQVGEENVTTRRVAVYPEPLGDRATEILHMSLLLCTSCDTSVSTHHGGQKGCGKNKMKQRGWLQSLLRIWVFLEEFIQAWASALLNRWVVYVAPLPWEF